jgi:hypothetical protein
VYVTAAVVLLRYTTGYGIDEAIAKGMTEMGDLYREQGQQLYSKDFVTRYAYILAAHLAA